MKSFLSMIAAPLRREGLSIFITTMLLAPVCVVGIARWAILSVLARISTPHYRSDRDILAPRYVPVRGMEPHRVAGAE